MDCSMPGSPVLHHLLEFAQKHVHWVRDAIQPAHPLSPPSPPAFNLSQHQIHLYFCLNTNKGKNIPACLSPREASWHMRRTYMASNPGQYIRIFQGLGLRYTNSQLRAEQTRVTLGLNHSLSWEYGGAALLLPHTLTKSHSHTSQLHTQSTENKINPPSHQGGLHTNKTSCLCLCH